MVPTYRRDRGGSESRSAQIRCRGGSFGQFLLKLLTRHADGGDMEPLDPTPRGATLPPPGDPVAPQAVVTAQMPVVSSEVAPPLPPPPPPARPSGETAAEPSPSWSATNSPTPASAPSTIRPRARVRPMAPWRIAGAASLTTTFAMMGWQVQGLIDDQGWSSGLMWASVAAGVATALCVLAWTWIATDNARRLVQPAVRSSLPDPTAAALTWAIPFALVGVAIGAVAMLGSQVDPGDDQSVSALPLGVAVIALLLAIPMTYRPLAHLAGVVRQVGGYSVRLAQWMWVPVVLGVVGIASIVALRFAGFDDDCRRCRRQRRLGPVVGRCRRRDRAVSHRRAARVEGGSVGRGCHQRGGLAPVGYVIGWFVRLEGCSQGACRPSWPRARASRSDRTGAGCRTPPTGHRDPGRGAGVAERGRRGRHHDALARLRRDRVAGVRTRTHLGHPRCAPCCVHRRDDRAARSCECVVVRDRAQRPRWHPVGGATRSSQRWRGRWRPARCGGSPTV